MNNASTSASATLLGLTIAFLVCLGQATPPFHSLAGYRYGPQFCQDPLTGRSMYVGEVMTRPGRCVRVQCLGTLELWEDSCSVPTMLTGTCNVLPSTEIGLSFPRCCPLYECKTYESNEQRTLEQTNTYDHKGKLRESHVTELIIVGKDRRLDSPHIPAAPERKYQV